MSLGEGFKIEVRRPIGIPSFPEHTFRISITESTDSTPITTDVTLSDQLEYIVLGAEFFLKMSKTTIQVGVISGTNTSYVSELEYVEEFRFFYYPENSAYYIGYYTGGTSDGAYYIPFSPDRVTYADPNGSMVCTDITAGSTLINNTAEVQTTFGVRVSGKDMIYAIYNDAATGNRSPVNVEFTTTPVLNGLKLVAVNIENGGSVIQVIIPENVVLSETVEKIDPMLANLLFLVPVLTILGIIAVIARSRWE